MKTDKQCLMVYRNEAVLYCNYIMFIVTILYNKYIMLLKFSKNYS